MSTAVAITDQICRTVLYLAGIGALVKLAPMFLPRVQVSATKNPPPPPPPPAGDAALNGQQPQQPQEVTAP